MCADVAHINFAVVVVIGPVKCCRTGLGNTIHGGIFDLAEPLGDISKRELAVAIAIKGLLTLVEQPLAARQDLVFGRAQRVAHLPRTHREVMPRELAIAIAIQQTDDTHCRLIEQACAALEHLRDTRGRILNGELAVAISIRQAM